MLPPWHGVLAETTVCAAALAHSCCHGCWPAAASSIAGWPCGIGTRQLPPLAPYDHFHHTVHLRVFTTNRPPGSVRSGSTSAFRIAALGKAGKHARRAANEGACPQRRELRSTTFVSVQQDKLWKAAGKEHSSRAHTNECAPRVLGLAEGARARSSWRSRSRGSPMHLRAVVTQRHLGSEGELGAGFGGVGQFTCGCPRPEWTGQFTVI